MFYIVRKKPFGEIILNVSNILSEFITILIFIFLSISLFDISKEAYDKVDEYLVIFVNTVLAIQMSSSIFVFVRTIYLFAKMKLRNRRQNLSIVPMSSNVGCMDENTYKE